MAGCTAQPFDKKRLKKFAGWHLRTFGPVKTVRMMERLKEIGFHAASEAGVSMNLEDLHVPEAKPAYLARQQERLQVGGAGMQGGAPLVQV